MTIKMHRNKGTVDHYALLEGTLQKAQTLTFVSNLNVNKINNFYDIHQLKVNVV
jgi:hypothetical protein